MERTDPPLAADERSTLEGFLDYQRDTLWQKVEGLDAEQLGQVHPPSTITLGGLVKHLALVEDWWFTCVMTGAPYPPPWDAVDWDGDPDWEWRTGAQETPDQLRAQWQESVARSRRAVADLPLDTLSQRPGRSGERFSLRWVMAHMLEEYARHNGHADLVRESVDGATGE